MFFDTIKKRYNHGIEIDVELKQKIEILFRYRWLHDRNQGMYSQEDISLLEQLPIETQNMLYRDYLYTDFLYEFRFVFNFRKLDGQIYSWDDEPFRNFMIGLLQNFEPRIEEKGTILFRELEDIHEVIFQEKGVIDIGFEINRIPKFVLRMNKGTIIGAYNCFENKKTIFIYRSYS